MSLKVAVRVRPFNTRETELKTTNCVEMDGNRTSLTDPQGQKRDFFFDYSFWSHDGYKINEEGFYLPVTEKYADQRKVFNTVGQEILNNAWEGYHCCLFAYGQTGSGKSYSMMGYGPNKGIVPISYQEIFNRIENSDNPNKTFEVQVK